MSIGDFQAVTQGINTKIDAWQVMRMFYILSTLHTHA